MSAENGRAPVAGVAAPAIDDERVAQMPGDPVAAAAAGARQDGSAGKRRGRTARRGARGRRAPVDKHEQQPGLSLAAHPRAARRVAESKAWGGLAGFVVGGYLSLAHHALLEAALRALVTGVVCYVVVWAAAVFVWRRLVVAELRQAEAALSDELAKRQAAQARREMSAARAWARRAALAGREVLAGREAPGGQTASATPARRRSDSGRERSWSPRSTRSRRSRRARAGKHRRRRPTSSATGAAATRTTPPRAGERVSESANGAVGWRPPARRRP